MSEFKKTIKILKDIMKHEKDGTIILGNTRQNIEALQKAIDILELCFNEKVGGKP